MDPSINRYLRITRNEHEDEDATYENRLWIPDPQIGYRLCSVLDDGVSDVLVGFRDEQGFFEKKRVERAGCEPPSRNTMGDDLCTLTEPNSATVLESLSRRYQQGVIHTYSGLFCVVLNPWKNVPIYSTEVMDEYRSDVGEQAPHVYSVAQEAYDGIMRSGRNQSILITGESGAGKTENTKKIIDFVLHSCGSDGDSSMGRDVVTTGVLLEAFGNARTTHNNNSSRFGKFIKIEFDNTGKLRSSQIECYLLEKSRVVSQNEGDRNFHIFYQLLSEGLSHNIRRALNLEGEASQYKFLNQGGDISEKELDDTADARETEAAMVRLGMSYEERLNVFEIAAACMMVGEIRFGERAGMDLSFVESMTEVEKVASLLRLKGNRIVDALTSPTIKVGDKLIRKNQNLKKTQFSAAALSKVLYERLFNYLLEKCNQAIGIQDESTDNNEERRFIGVLDIAGFEIMQKNSFEQFCINFTNEKLQQFFNHFMFVKEQAEYEEEGISWTHINYAEDLQPTINAIEKPMGLLALLEEECVMPNGSDTSLLGKFCTNMKDASVFTKAKQSLKNKTVVHFTIQHYAGAVDYNIDSWIEKNRDVVENSVLSLLAESSQPLVRKLFPPVVTDSLKSRRGTISQASVTYVYKNQLQTLLDCLNLSSAHFVRCVVPNYERKPGKIDGPLVLHQLRCNGVLEGIRICRKGFPSRLPFADFIHRYSILGGAHFEGVGKDGCRKLLTLVSMACDRYQIGNTKVFCKVGVISELEALRRDWLSSMIAALQAHIRSIVMQRDCYDRLKKKSAMLTIQNNVRTFAELSQWPWFRLMSLVRPLIPKDRERLRIDELEKLIHDLEMKNEAARQENERVNQRMSSLERDYLKQLEGLRKEKAEMEEKLRKKIEEVTKDYQHRLEQSEQELASLKRNMAKKLDEDLEDYRHRLQAAERENEELRKQQEKNISSYKSRCDTAERKAVELEQKIAKMAADKEKEMKKLQSEMEQNEDVFGLLEKKYNEQHQKVLKLNDTLRDYERRLDEAAMTKSDMEKELKRNQDQLERELLSMTLMQKDHEGCVAKIAELEARIQMLMDENSHLKLMLAGLENDSEDSKARNQRQNDTISELQKLIEELNSKVTRFDQTMLEEKNKRRKVQHERDNAEDKLSHLQDHHDKLKKKYEALKDTLRQRDNTIRILEKKLEDKDAIMNDCLKDLKDNHKARLCEMEEKMDEYKRQNNKLESENSMQRMRMDQSYDRESSVDSDYGFSGRSSSGRLSAVGRQYSLTSCSSFSSIRTLNRRRETEPDLSSSLYLPRRRDSTVDLTQSYSLQRNTSNSNIEKDRKISELERQIQTINTDLNLQKRELEVYKTSLGTIEAEKDRLTSQNRSNLAEMDSMKRQLAKAEQNADMLAMRLKRAQEDAEGWKKKHEQLIEETKNEILSERKRASERMDSARQEQNMKQGRLQQIESAREELQSELTRTHADLDRAIATIHELEHSMHSQEFLGDSMETNYRNLLSDLESLREENGTLKAKIRRQTKQIELLTQQDSTDDMMNHIQSKVAL